MPERRAPEWERRHGPADGSDGRVVIGIGDPGQASPLGGGHAPDDGLLTSALEGQVMVAALAALLHALAMLATSGAIALLVYDVVGLRILRTA